MVERRFGKGFLTLLLLLQTNFLLLHIIANSLPPQFAIFLEVF